MQDPAKFHASTLVIDTHADTPQRFVDEGWNFSDPLGGGMLNLESARRGNLSAEFLAIWVEPTQWRGRYAFRTLQLIDGVYEQLRKHPTTMRLGLTPADIVQAHQDCVFCALLGIEGGHSIEADLGLLRVYHRLGVRYMTLTWSNSNEWADSSGDLNDPRVQHHDGLTRFGRSVIREMNSLGMMVDVSHVSDKTFWDVLQTTHAPIIASHSSARALTDSARNLTDEQLRAVATNNGVVMVNFYPSFIDDNWRTAWSATQPQREPLYAAAAAPYLERGEPVPYAVPLAVDREFYAQHPIPLAPLESLIDHFDHVAQVAGIDHVGIGSDFDGFALLPAEIASAADLPKITAALLQRGYTEEQMKKLLGGNLLRVFADVQAAAEKEQEP
ncbi:dipeptidase [Granulicella sp. S156]|uniref:dipeptidase n=1 Tax=Granulicella sp. S156 TaxID=1747224 RepID=UPI00131DE753|nr:dipeptidase [Granulicella sp. S156]